MINPYFFIFLDPIFVPRCLVSIFLSVFFQAPRARINTKRIVYGFLCTWVNVVRNQDAAVTVSRYTENLWRFRWVLILCPLSFDCHITNDKRKMEKGSMGKIGPHVFHTRFPFVRTVGSFNALI